jgi:hypothetical protein
LYIRLIVRRMSKTKSKPKRVGKPKRVRRVGRV